MVYNERRKDYAESIGAEYIITRSKAVRNGSSEEDYLYELVEHITGYYFSTELSQDTVVYRSEKRISLNKEGCRECCDNGLSCCNTPGVKHLSEVEIKEIYNSRMFQRALMSDSAVGLRALNILLPKKLQTAELICKIIQDRDAIYGHKRTGQSMFLYDFFDAREEWGKYLAFNDIMKMRDLATKYDMKFSNEKGKICPGIHEEILLRKSDTPYELKSAFKYLAEQERIMQQESEKGK